MINQIVVFMKTRSEHLQWCKDRAMPYIENGDVKGAFASFVSDMRKHPDTTEHMAIGLGLALMASGGLSTPKQMKEFINGFN